MLPRPRRAAWRPGRIEREIEAASASGDRILDVAERWFQSRKQTVNTQRLHRQYLLKLVSWACDPPIGAVTARMIADFTHQMLKRVDNKGRALLPVSVTRRVDTVMALMRYAKRAGVISENPAADVLRPTDPRPRAAQSYMPLSVQDCRRLLAVSEAIWTRERKIAHPERAFDLRAALRLLMLTGARPNEIAQLRRADIDAERGVLVISDAPTSDEFRPRRVKTASSIGTVPLHSVILPELRVHVARSDHVLLFPSFAPEHHSASYSSKLQDEWSAHVRPVVAFDHPKKVLDSTRHLFAVEAERIEMLESIKHELMGHTNGATRNPSRCTANAASVDLGRLGRFLGWIERMEFPALEDEGRD